MYTMLCRAIVAAAAILAVPHLALAQPDTQGLIKERDAQTEKLRQEDAARAQRELLERDQQERAARQRLESGRIERLPAPNILLPGAPPNLSNGAPLPGFTDRAATMSRDEAARRDQRDYDAAARARDDAARGVPDFTGRVEPWKPTGAK
jgi:hypothetical protein